MTDKLELRYGCNPHQTPATISVATGQLPITVLNGQPGYINLLDALNAWQLVKELKQALDLPAATSFKHVSPAGAAVGLPMTEAERQAQFVADVALSPLATAYARARGADRMSSFGDWAALSDVVDVPTARLLKREVSDGVIAPGYEPEALTILQAKKKGSYRIIQIDPTYEPPLEETRQLYGITFSQRRNDALTNRASLQNLVTKNKTLPKTAVIDLILTLITLKYTQSNAITLAYNGQIIGVGAGQQSRIHCTRLAAAKADLWFLRQHPTLRNLPFKPKIGRPAKDNAIDQFLLDDGSPLPNELFTETPQRLTQAQKAAWLAQISGVSLGSDAFIPFRDNIDRAHQSGVSYVAQPGGSLRDEGVIAACDQYNMVMAFTGIRLFHH